MEIKVEVVTHNDPKKFGELIQAFLNDHEDEIIEEFYFSSSMGVVQQSAIVKNVGQVAPQMNLVTIYTCVFHFDPEKKPEEIQKA